MPSQPRIISTRMRAFTPLGVAVVLGIAAFTRFWALGHPDELVFDELYYVRDAITQLAHGFPTTWPDDDPKMALPFTDEASYAVHPPLGKWLIALGLLVFGDDTGWGWRSASALSGVLAVAVTMRLGWRMTRSVWASLIAGVALAVDGVHIVLSRVSLLDGFLTLCVVLGALFMWRDHETVVDRAKLGPMQPWLLWNRPWLVAAAAAFGLAASVKWSGLYPLAAFLLLTTGRDIWLRVRDRVSVRGARPWLGGILQAFVTGLLTLPVTLAVYVTSWWGWIASVGGWGRSDGAWPIALWRYHVSMFEWHSTLSAPHPFQANPLGWPLALRPTAMYHAAAGTGFTEVISPLPNPLVTWGGVAALLVMLWWIIGRRPVPGSPRFGAPGLGTYPLAFILAGYLSGWLPWVLTFSRSAVFQFYAVVLTPFSALALALVVSSICGLLPGQQGDFQERRLSAALFFVATLVLTVLFFPVWTGMPITDGFWRWHLWLPGWS